MAKDKGVNMLCLDGGGIKGLVTIQMLKEVERYLKHPLNAYFKWFAGTSTGSFICAFLATVSAANNSVQMDLADLICKLAFDATRWAFDCLLCSRFI